MQDKVVVDLSQWIKQRRLDIANHLMECSQIHVQGICMCITEYVLEEAVLIPNTTDPTEFAKHWFIIPNGSSDVPHDHQVTVRTPTAAPYAEIQLIQAGAIASINEYIPSKNAKLKIQCGIRWKDRRDYLTFSTRSNGTRRSKCFDIGSIPFHCGPDSVDGGGRTVTVLQNDRKSPSLLIELSRQYPSSRQSIGIGKVPSIPYYSTVEIIDDGENVEVCYDDGQLHELWMDGVSHGQRNHIAIWNRGQPGCVLDITSLTVSVVMNSLDTAPRTSRRKALLSQYKKWLVINNECE